MALKDIFCQDNAVSILHRGFACNRVAHAYIFAGLDGVGKLKAACEWAKLLLCKNPIGEKVGASGFVDSCGRCDSCRLFEAGSHSDFNHVYKELLEFTRDGKGRTAPVELPIDVVREFLIEKVFTKPTLSNRKVFVISEAEKLNASSQNALLKVLEEPPTYCCIILVCTRLERLLPTTRSRCQIIRFGPIDEGRIIERLQQMGVEKGKALYFARLAQGSLGAACQWAQMELADADLYQAKRNLVQNLSQHQVGDALATAQELLDRGKAIASVWAKFDPTTSRSDLARRAQKTIILMVTSALRDALMLNVAGSKAIINIDQKDEITRLARRFGPEVAADRITDCYKSLRWIEAGVNEKLVFEQLLLNLAGSDIISGSL